MTTITLDNQTGETLHLKLHPDANGCNLAGFGTPTETTLENGQTIQLYTLEMGDRTYPSATEIADSKKTKICNFTPSENKRNAKVWVKDTQECKRANEINIMTFPLTEVSEIIHTYSKWFFGWKSDNVQTHTLTLSPILD